MDYSGKSGAPCLLVVSDRVQGGKDKVWVWPSAFRSEVVGGKFAGKAGASEERLPRTGGLRRVPGE